MSLDSKINSYLKTNEGKKKVAEAKAMALKKGQTFGQPGTSISKEDAKRVAEKIRAILSRKLIEAHLEDIAVGGIIVDEPTVGRDGNVSVGIAFNEDMLRRDSLYPEKYPAGIANIVVHLTHGWDADNYVYGYWDRASKRIRSAKHFDGKPFMQQAIDEFNAMGLGIAELNDKYKT